MNQVKMARNKLSPENQNKLGRLQAALKPEVRVRGEDLHLVADYLDGYDPESPEMSRVAGVAAWLRAEADRREQEAVVRSVKRQTGMSAKVIRERMRKDSAS